MMEVIIHRRRLCPQVIGVYMIVNVGILIGHFSRFQRPLIMEERVADTSSSSMGSVDGKMCLSSGTVHARLMRNASM
jgi:hypothetical protein